MVSRVGNDDYGREILAEAEKKGINTENITLDLNHPTGTVTVSLDEYGKPDFIIHKDVAWDFLEWSNNLKVLAKRCDAIVFGSLAQRSIKSRETIQRLLNSTRKDSIRVFDINLRQSFYSREIIEDSLHVCEILKINDDELSIVSNLLNVKGSAIDVIWHLINKYSIGLVALTCGSEGSFLVKNNKISHHHGFKVDVVDTVGAGDAFTAALIVGALKGNSLDEINENANRLASYVCTQRGALPTIPDSIKKLFNS